MKKLNRSRGEKTRENKKGNERAKKINGKGKIPSLNLIKESEIAMDFAAKAYEKFNKIIKSIILFGSSVKNTAVSDSDIDIIIVIDDASIKWDMELIAWYREELSKLIQQNPYRKELHINTVKLTTWWNDLLKGDPVIINVLRYGEALIDFGGFFNPIKALLLDGRVKITPEAIYTCLQRAPAHFARSKAAELGSIEGLFWAMVDSSHAALMSSGEIPPSPEHIAILLKDRFVDKGKLKMKYAVWYRDLYVLHRKIIHGEIRDIKGQEIDDWQVRTDEFIRVMAELVGSSVRK